MWNKEECEVAKSYYTKVSELRADVHTMDWADDKRLSLGSYGGYGYLSMDKIVKQIAPLFNRHGLEIELRYYDLQQVNSSDDKDQYHWTVCLDVTLVDITTGYKGAPTTVMGESADRGDKGVTKAETSAYKNWHIKFFDLADGIDPDSDSGFAQEVRKFNKTEAEKEEVTSKVLAAAKKSAEPSESIQEILDRARGPAAPVQEKPAPKAETQPAAEAPAESSKFVPKAPQKKAIEGIIKTWETLAKEGKVTPEEYNEMSGAYSDINSDAAAVAFIRNYRRNL